MFVAIFNSVGLPLATRIILKIRACAPVLGKLVTDKFMLPNHKILVKSNQNTSISLSS